MNYALPLPDEKKLLVTYRVESGCLGPEGECYVQSFCEFAQRKIQPLYSDFIAWNVISRDNKDEPEIQYNLVTKRVSNSQASRYFTAFGSNLDQFEIDLSEKLAELIDEFMGH